MLLFIDCYDSFSYNLTNLISDVVQKDVVLVHMDSFSASDFRNWVPGIECVIIGPGPGNPENELDCGVIPHLWDIIKEFRIPTLGICFGFQSLVLHFGGTIHRLPFPVHGQVCEVLHTESKLFNSIPEKFDVVRYHSLFVEPKNLKTTAYCDDVLMAVEHEDLPLYGVQFHPESVLSTYGKQIIQNFWVQTLESNRGKSLVGIDMPLQTVTYTPLLTDLEDQYTGNVPNVKQLHFESTKCDLTECFANELGLNNIVLLKSQATPGEWTVFGHLTESTMHVRSKTTESGTYMGRLNGEYEHLDLPVFNAISNYMRGKLITDNQRTNEYTLPFLGGFMGYITYEGACETGLGRNQSLDMNLESDMHSDVSMVFIEETILINESSQTVYAVGSLEWIAKVEMIMKSACVTQTSTTQDKVTTTNSTSSSPSSPAKPQVISIKKPVKEEYINKIKQCFEYLHSGDSYELCLTDQTELEIIGTNWDIFSHVLKSNPAPYASYMCFDDCLISTSPERFVKWTPQKCEFRPIKGTVKKANGVGLTEATQILRTRKEQAENLMIVDLIRHDIGHLLSKIQCPELMKVEEYHTVYQLVTSIEGEFNSKINGNKGIDILTQSLPPGSMTGAPKKRSVELLHKIEKSPRNLYSGVQGYWSITDQADWSVVIRSLYSPKHKHTNNNTTIGKWYLGAGGGVTVLSDPVSEFEEMQTKLDSVLTKLKLS